MPYGRSFAHSLVVLIPLSLALYLVLKRREQVDYVLAFTTGALSHVIVDVLPAIVSREYEFASVLFWPLLPVAVRSAPGSFSDHVLRIKPTPYFIFQIVLTIIAGLLWRRDGKPGYSYLRETSRDVSRQWRFD